MPGKPSIFSCSAINAELFTLQCQQLPKFCPFVSALKDLLFHSWERKFQGMKVPRSESSLELLLAPWNFRFRERKFLGAKLPAFLFATLPVCLCTFRRLDASPLDVVEKPRSQQTYSSTLFLHCKDNQWH